MQSQRLLIRKFVPYDWKDLFDYLSQEDVVRYEPYSVFTEEQAKEEAIKRSKDSCFWAVCLLETKKVIGNIYLEKQEFETWELGYVFNKDYQGMGYATEAVKALMNDIFINHNAHRILAMCNPLNTSSWKLMERLRMRHEAHHIQNIWFFKDKDGNPIWQDTYMYAILKEEWTQFIQE